MRHARVMERHKALRESRIAASLCATCGQTKPRKGYRDCEPCASKVRLRMRKPVPPPIPLGDVWEYLGATSGLEAAINQAEHDMGAIA